MIQSIERLRIIFVYAPAIGILDMPFFFRTDTGAVRIQIPPEEGRALFILDVLRR